MTAGDAVHVVPRARHPLYRAAAQRILEQHGQRLAQVQHLDHEAMNVGVIGRQLVDGEEVLHLVLEIGRPLARRLLESPVRHCRQRPRLEAT